MIPEYRIDYLRKALGHRYEFQAFLGRGAFATVLLVRNRKLGRQEALKVLLESFDGDHEFAKRFVDEARLVASLDHPNIVKVYDYGDVDGVLWYSMQYIAGPSLSAELNARKPLSQQESISLAVPLLDALAYSHSVGIVHRDVKPGNVMISPRGRPYLMDFGIAKVKDSGFKTATGSVLGTPAYISPEQASGEEVDGRSDVYSLGICLYQWLTGALPFPASDPIRMLLRRLKEDPEPLSKLNPSIHPELERVVLKSLARSKEERFQSADDMKAQILGTFQHQVEIEAVRVTAVVDKPAPLKKSAKVEALPEPVADGSRAVSEIISEAPTIVTQRNPAAEAPRRTSAWIPWVLVSVLILAVAFFFLQPEDSPSPKSVEDPSAATSEAPLPGSPSAPVADVGPSEEASASGSSSAQPIQEEVSKNPSSGESGGPVREPEPSEREPSSPLESRAESLSEPRTQVPEPTASESAPPVSRPTESVAQEQPRPARRAVTPPAIVEAPEIVLDEITTQKCSSTEVILTVSIDAEGRVDSSRALAAPDKACELAAIQHVKSYRFKPGRDFESKPVASKLTLSIRFP